ncbi:MAG: alpha/beta hydrolase [Deltaproteobacteria bacterium]|nr:alpha/beta hydrolase [Deltaproteobacteria bacterium]
MSEGRPIELPLPGLTLRGLAWGPREAPPVLALHGWLDNAASFSTLAPRLEGRQVVALDLPGHGRSDHRAASASYNFIDWVPDVLLAVDTLGWGRFSLLGHSMGAGIACLLAGALPERVERLVLIEGFGPLTEAAEAAPARLARHLVQRGFGGEPRVMAGREEAVERMLRASHGLERSSAELLAARGTREVEGGVVWAWDPRLRQSSAIRLTEEQVIAFLSRIEAPVLVVRGVPGWPADEALLDGRKAAVKDLTVRELAGGHHLHLDHPEPVAEVVRAHLER